MDGLVDRADIRVEFLGTREKSMGFRSQRDCCSFSSTARVLQVPGQMVVYSHAQI